MDRAGRTQRKRPGQKEPRKANGKRKEEDVGPEVRASMKKYRRGDSNALKGITDKKLKGALRREERRIKDAELRAAKLEILQTEEAGALEAEGMERTYKFTQAQIAEHVDIASAHKVFDLKLDAYGSYNIDYTRNGKFIVIGGEKGHVATFDWRAGRLGCELFLQETVRDVQWLHNETMFAVAQRKYVYIYDNNGVELHCLRQHAEPSRLAFLPYHYLLLSVGAGGVLKYQDVSTGQLVAEHKSRLGPCHTLAQNPHNAVALLGHGNGTVTMWTPNMSTPVVKMLCHRGPVLAAAVDLSGRYMVTSGADSQVKVFDVRTYKELQAYYSPTPASTLDISQRGLLAVGFGPHVQVWKDAFATKQQSPHMNHLIPRSSVSDVRFCPFEDVLGIGHRTGLASILVPGAGEANFDALENNPFETRRQRQEGEVKSLLEKIQPEMITLDPSQIGTVARDRKEEMAEDRRLAFEANNPGLKYEPKFRARGKSSSQRRYLRKQTNVVDANRIALRERLDKEKAERDRRHTGGEAERKPKTALDRFTPRR